MDAQLKKGVLELCILGVLARGRCYGYELVREMQPHFPDVGESTFYAILRRLGAEGAAQVFRGEASGGPVRKYYEITLQGREKLTAALSEWRRIAAVVEATCIRDP